MKQITVSSHISRFMMEAHSKYDMVESMKLKMATDIAREILNKVEITTYKDISGDLKYTLSFFMTTSKEQADMINEMMPVIEKLYRACNKEGHYSDEI